MHPTCCVNHRSRCDSKLIGDKNVIKHNNKKEGPKVQGGVFFLLTNPLMDDPN